MGKFFNVSAVCRPELHYMVDLSERLEKIKAMVDAGQYFTINRARQFGKTTTLRELSRFLDKDYIVISLDFQLFGDAKFKNENVFSLAFARSFLREFKAKETLQNGTLQDFIHTLNITVQNQNVNFELLELFECISDICSVSERPLVLMIDEVDCATNNRVFLDFLAQLRGYYIDRDRRPTFQSVILAGVYDVKNLKRKFVNEGDHRTNSPWNIAADFFVDMSFSVKDISGMLDEYEVDYNTGMNVTEIASLIYDYTSGYPFLVSRLCKLLDEQVAGSDGFPDKSSAWTRNGVLEAVKILLTEPNTLFESLLNKLDDYPELKDMIRELLFKGRDIPFVMGVPAIEMALMFGFVKKSNSIIVIANRIYETLLYNLYLSSPETQQDDIYDAALKDKSQFIQNGHLNMRLVLEKFVRHFDDLYGDQDQTFYEEDGRRYFLLYLRPIINGTGNYYIEAQTRNMERTDVIVDYRGEQFVIELKIWRGNAYHMRGEAQLIDYLNYYHLKKGYMLSFNFNQNKQVGIREIALGDKLLVEAVV